MTDDIDDVDVDRGPVKIAVDQLTNEYERPRGIFTSVDRKFISGFKKYDHKQSENNRRNSIIERLVNSVCDFRLLSWLSTKERKKVFCEIDKGQLHDCVVSLLAFVYRGIENDDEAIEQMVQTAIFRVEAADDPREGYQGGVANVSVDINIEHGYDAEEIYERLQQGGPRELTPTEIGVLVQSGKLNTDELEQFELGGDDETPKTGALDEKPWYMSDYE